MLLSIATLLCLVSGVQGLRLHDDRALTVSVNTDSPLREVDERFSSIAMGTTLIKKRWLTFDVRSVRLQTLAKALSPAYLRFGGTYADFMTFVPDSRGNTNPPVNLQEVLNDPSYYESLDSYGHNLLKVEPFNMTGEDFEKINNFAHNAGWKFLFDHNVLKRKDGKWDPTNAKQILDYSVKHGYNSNQLFELGNEPDSMPYAINRTVTAEELGQDFLTLHEIIHNSEYGRYYQHAKLVGDDTSHSSDFKYNGVFLQKAGSVLDAVTWHHYYIDGRIAQVTDFIDPKLMDSLIPKINKMNTIVKQTMPPGTKIWFGETGSAYGGGARNLSNTYVAGFLLMDKLGLAATMGLDVVLRQTFYGGFYAMIDVDLNPLPDYWLSLIFKVLVGTKVLNVTLSEDTRSVRLYAHCTSTARSGYPAGSVTMYGMNVNDYDVTVKLGGSLSNQIVDEYLMHHDEGGLTSTKVQVNDQVLEMVDDHTLPRIEPRRLSAGQDIVIPSRSFGFFVVPGAQSRACGHTSDRL